MPDNTNPHSLAAWVPTWEREPALAPSDWTAKAAEAAAKDQQP